MNAKRISGAVVFAIVAGMVVPSFAADHREAPLFEEDITVDMPAGEVGVFPSENLPAGEVGIFPSENQPAGVVGVFPSENLPARVVGFSPPGTIPGGAVGIFPSRNLPSPAGVPTPRR